MALKNFVKSNSYTRINQITIQKEAETIYFEIKVYEEKDGALLLSPVSFKINYKEETGRYKEKNIVLPDAPVYPALCTDREALVPMWTDESTPEEIAAYDAAKAAYAQDIEDHQAEIDTMTAEVEATAETENEYTKYFSDQKLYQDSNVTACAYEYLKSLPGFEEVADA
jgi:hypothetical protein